jgi:glycosyltransferase involved in cell wall biosynthesis
MKRIGMILDVERGFPPDIRVEKEARALIKAGFEVSLLAQKADSSQAVYEKLNYGLEVFRTEIQSQQDLFHKILTKVSLVKEDWLSVIDNFVKEVRPDVLHAHDFTIVPTALEIARKCNLPLVADLHENMPAAIVAYRSNLEPLRKFRASILDNYYLWRWREKLALRKCFRIIVVVPEAAERILNNYDIPREKVCIVSNTEDETTFSVSDLDEKIIQDYKGIWAALYIGGIGPHRGIDTAIRSAAIAGKNIPNFKLLVVGIQGAGQRQQVIQIAEKTNTTDYLELVDWVPANKVNSYIAASKVCLVPHNDFEHTNTTAPHKLFQYMIMKKPVIVSSCKPLKRIVEDTGSGLVFNANNSESLADCLIKLYEDGNEIAEKYGENGHRAVLGKYSWKNDSGRLVKMYKDLALNLGG